MNVSIDVQQNTRTFWSSAFHNVETIKQLINKQHTNIYLPLINVTRKKKNEKKQTKCASVVTFTEFDEMYLEYMPDAPYLY